MDRTQCRSGKRLVGLSGLPAAARLMAAWGLLESSSQTMAVAQVATTQVSSVSTGVSAGGVSGLWVLANLSYAGMRAQGHKSRGWRIVSFLLGFPGTFVSFIVVEEGQCRAYGIDLPRRAD